VSLDLGYTISPETQQGNLILERSSATKADGTTIAMGDVYFDTRKQATLTVQSQPAKPKIPQFPPAEHPILVNWPVQSNRPATEVAVPKPVIEWSAWNASTSDDTTDTKKKVKADTTAHDTQAPKSAWLNDFLGTDKAEKPDLAKATGLTVRLKPPSSEPGR